MLSMPSSARDVPSMDSAVKLCQLLQAQQNSVLSGPPHPPKEKYSLKSCYCGLFSFQDQHTLPKRNILSKLSLWLARMEFPFRTSTPSQSEIFSQNCYCGLLCVFAFQDQHTLPKRNILSNCYCGLLSLLVCMYWSSRTSTPSQSEIFSLKTIIVACSVYLHSRTSTPSQSEIFCQSCYCGLLVWSFLSGPSHPPKERHGQLHCM